MSGITIMCPNTKCGHKGPPEDFDMSLAAECFCPACGCQFIVDFDDVDDDEEPAP